MAKSSDRHHILPKSRGGGRKKNITVLPVGFHRALHQVFQDLTREEYAIFLDEVLRPGTTWTSRELHYLRIRIKETRQ